MEIMCKSKMGDIKHNQPSNLKISHVAMIPHKSRTFRCILNLSYGRKIDLVNRRTNKLALQNDMAQLRWVIKRIITMMALHFGFNNPFIFPKFDIKDRFGRNGS